MRASDGVSLGGSSADFGDDVRLYDVERPKFTPPGADFGVDAEFAELTEGLPIQTDDLPPTSWITRPKPQAYDAEGNPSTSFLDDMQVWEHGQQARHVLGIRKTFARAVSRPRPPAFRGPARRPVEGRPRARGRHRVVRRSAHGPPGRRTSDDPSPPEPELTLTARWVRP
jgi:hypothetical protein